MQLQIVIPFCLFIIAFLYASVGHGGASGYIAILTLFNIPLANYKPVVLILNIIIALIAFIQFYRAGYFKWKLAWPFLSTSIVAAFLGSQLVTQEKTYKLILGLALLFPIVRLLQTTTKEKPVQKELYIPTAMLLGAVIGFISGFLNIGGGIFLSPLIILLAWGNVKEAAAVSALFIVCNSLSGLLAIGNNITGSITASLYWIIAAVWGGLLGAYLGSHKYSLPAVRYVLSVVLCIAAVKLIFS